jgi:DNA (cytosine-5)-methyltransferase 1
MNHLDLFSGIGGFSIAAEQCGFKTIGFSEINPYASSILKRHWPDVPNFGDITKSETWPNIGPVRLLTGGFPCQPFSVSGKRLGASDDRALWSSMLRVIERFQPDWVVGENVPGIINMELDNVLSDLESVGYSAWPLVIPACAVDARHRRDRVWILAHANSTQCQRRSVSSRAHQEHTNAVSVCRWETEPEFCRMAHGLPNQSHRLKALGNSIVPQVACEIIRNIALLTK